MQSFRVVLDVMLNPFDIKWTPSDVYGEIDKLIREYPNANISILECEENEKDSE